jgi:hypothetical protein
MSRRIGSGTTVEVPTGDHVNGDEVAHLVEA